MSDEPKKRSRAWIVWAVLVIPLLYTLSIGPAVWLELYSPLRGEKLRQFDEAAYAPLRRVHKTHPILEAAVDRYANLWVSLGPIP
ncbi:MAG TPA: hypothetical protein VGP63_19095 [Planctomycetaceae bacterium]|jgi:hypothetical protein|nr:hypothetical protein [Planctomycetaceae bacterium]